MSATVWPNVIILHKFKHMSTNVEWKVIFRIKLIWVRLRLQLTITLIISWVGNYLFAQLSVKFQKMSVRSPRSPSWGVDLCDQHPKSNKLSLIFNYWKASKSRVWGTRTCKRSALVLVLIVMLATQLRFLSHFIVLFVKMTKARVPCSVDSVRTNHWFNLRLFMSLSCFPKPFLI